MKTFIIGAHNDELRTLIPIRGQSAQKEWRRPELRKLPIEATASSASKAGSLMPAMVADGDALTDSRMLYGGSIS